MTFNPFVSGPKFRVICGECSNQFSERIQMVNDPEVLCPHCGTFNQLKGIVVE